MKKTKTKLTSYERDLEKNITKSKSAKNQKSLKQSLVKAAESYLSERKPVTIRLLASDIESMKIKASKMGIPYQTYINIIIHRDAVAA